MSEINELRKQLAELKARIDAFEKDVCADFDKVVVDGIEYYDSKKIMTHREALELAARNGLRVMESWEMHKLLVESEDFRKSLAPKWYWCASVGYCGRYNAWRFNGCNGYVETLNRDYYNIVRCVAIV